MLTKYYIDYSYYFFYLADIAKAKAKARKEIDSAGLGINDASFYERYNITKIGNITYNNNICL